MTMQEWQAVGRRTGWSSGRSRRCVAELAPPSNRDSHRLFQLRILAVTNMYPSAEFPSQGAFVHEQIKSLRAAGLEVRVLFADRRREGPAVY